MVNAEQIFNPEFLTRLSKSLDRFYDSEQGAFNQGYEHFHNAAGQATIVKAAANELGLESTTYGTSKLPDDTLHPEGPAAGYDWELVDNRWVVDLWRVSYNGDGPVVYDLADPAQLDLAERTFGPSAKWEKLAVVPAEMELANKIWHNFTLPQRAVDDLLSGKG